MTKLSFKPTNELSWQEPVIDIITTLEEISPEVGDRYIYENEQQKAIITWYDYGDWAIDLPEEGWIVYVKQQQTYYRYDGQDWTEFSSKVEVDEETGVLKIDGVATDVKTSTQTRKEIVDTDIPDFRSDRIVIREVVNVLNLSGNNITWNYRGALPNDITKIKLSGDKVNWFWGDAPNYASKSYPLPDGEDIEQLDLIDYRIGGNLLTDKQLLQLLKGAAGRTYNITAAVFDIRDYDEFVTSVEDIKNAEPDENGSIAEQIKYWIEFVFYEKMKGIGIIKINEITVSARTAAYDTSGNIIPFIRHNGKIYHIFKDVGESTLNIADASIAIEYLFQAGGGSGGVVLSDNCAGGGAAGGCIDNTASLAKGVHTIKVGDGGAGLPRTNADGNNGENTWLKDPDGILIGVEAIGGGGGGSQNNDGKDGGCGGGAGSTYTYDPGGEAQYKNGGVGSQGGDGGIGSSHDVNDPITERYLAGGGGGGIYGNGEDSEWIPSGVQGYGGDGGSGKSFEDIWTDEGLNTVLEAVLGFSRFGGGGGACGYVNNHGSGKDGGTGGARRAKTDDAQANTGAGSGGANGSGAGAETGNGGSGLCIIRYDE